MAVVDRARVHAFFEGVKPLLAGRYDVARLRAYVDAAELEEREGAVDCGVGLTSTGGAVGGVLARRGRGCGAVEGGRRRRG